MSGRVYPVDFRADARGCAPVRGLAGAIACPTATSPSSMQTLWTALPRDVAAWWRARDRDEDGGVGVAHLDDAGDVVFDVAG